MVIPPFPLSIQVCSSQHGIVDHPALPIRPLPPIEPTPYVLRFLRRKAGGPPLPSTRRIQTHMDPSWSWKHHLGVIGTRNYGNSTTPARIVPPIQGAVNMPREAATTPPSICRLPWSLLPHFLNGFPNSPHSHHPRYHQKSRAVSHLHMALPRLVYQQLLPHKILWTFMISYQKPPRILLSRQPENLSCPWPTWPK